MYSIYTISASILSDVLVFVCTCNAVIIYTYSREETISP